MKKIVLLLAILIPFSTFAACDKKADEPDKAVELAKAEAEKAKAEAEKAKAEADKAKADAGKAEADANKAKAEADKAEADANKAKAEAEKAQAEAIENDDGTYHVSRYTPPEVLPDLDGTVSPKGLVLVMGVRPERGIKKIRQAGTEDGTYIISELFERTIAFSSERRKSMSDFSTDKLKNLIRKIDPDSHDIIVEKDDKMSAQMTYPSWKITYESGQNEDTRKCVDYYIQTEEFDFRFHTSIPIDKFNRNTGHLEAWFENLELREI